MKRFQGFLLLAVIVIISTCSCTKNIFDNKNSKPKVSQPPVITSSVTPAPQQRTTEEPMNNIESLSLEKDFRFIVLADSRGSDKGVNSKIVKKILNEVKQLSPQPEFAIMPGDLTEGSKSYSVIKSQLKYFKNIVTQFYPTRFFYPGIGNHEMKAGENGEKAFSVTFWEFKANFLEGYNRTSYYFDVGNTRLFMLNSNHPGEKHKITGDQLDWLKSNINKDIKYNIFLFHEPPYPTGAEAGYSLDKNPAARDALWEVIDSSNNPIVFCGHEHNYSRRLIDNSFNEEIRGESYEYRKGIYQIISGGFGAPLYEKYTLKKNIVIAPIPQFHFTVVDINEKGVSIQAINIDGEVIDSFQAYE